MPEKKRVRPRAGNDDRQSLGDGLGVRLREARESRSIGLRELARRIGVSPSLISQIETGKSEPSVSTLQAIVAELDVSANEVVFGAKETTRPRGRSSATSSRRSASPRKSHLQVAFDALSDPSGDAGLLQRSHSRRTIHLESGVTWQRLTAAPDHDVDFLYVHYEPGGASAPSDSHMRHHGREYGYVVSGRLLVSVGFDDYELGPGDSIAFDSTEPHRLATIGDEPAEAVWFVVGRRQAPGPESDVPPPSP
jgi:transcriptional regulator with XRE-family HTH domain